MITRLIASAGAVLLTVILLIVLTPSPAAAAFCLVRCENEEVEGTILGGLMPNILFGLLIGLVIAVIASFLAFREGKKRAPMSIETDVSERRDL